MGSSKNSWRIRGLSQDLGLRFFHLYSEGDGGSQWVSTQVACWITRGTSKENAPRISGSFSLGKEVWAKELLR